jgi:hypothetical protein
MLIDYCGRGVVIQPTKKELDYPYIGPKLSEALRGAEISAVDRIRIFRQISERFLTEWGNRHEMFEKFNGTPLYLINLLTMQRTEYQVDGPLTELARQVLVLPWVTAKCQREALAPGSFGAQVYGAVDTGESPQTKRRCWSAPSCRRDSTPPSAGYRRTRQAYGRSREGVALRQRSLSAELRASPGRTRWLHRRRNGRPEENSCHLERGSGMLASLSSFFLA